MGLKPFLHQEQGAKYAVERNGACLWMKMRTGKTLTTILALKKAGAFPVLIICPKSIMPVWYSEFMREGADPRMVDMVDGPYSRRNKMLENPAPVVIVNFEMIEPYRVLTRYKWPAIVIDESLKIGNITSKRTQACLDYIESRKYPADQMRFCLSGSPASESAFQLVPQMFFVLGHFMGYTSWEKYVMDNWKYNNYSYTWAPIRGKAHLNEIKKFNEENAFHCDLKLGDNILRRRIQLQPTDYQTKLLDGIRNGELYVDRDGTQKKYTPLVRANHELQVCAGLNPFTKKVFDLRKIQQILEWHIDNDKEPCLVVSELREGLMDAFLEEAGRYKGKNEIRVGVMVGGQPEQNKIAHSKFDAGELDIIFGQVEVVKMGLNFARASTIHYLTNSYSQDDRTQSELRCTQIGKDEPTEVFDYVTEGCLDGSLVDLLEKKQSLSASYVQEWIGLKEDKCQVE